MRAVLFRERSVLRGKGVSKLLVAGAGEVGTWAATSLRPVDGRPQSPRPGEAEESACSSAFRIQPAGGAGVPGRAVASRIFSNRFVQSPWLQGKTST